MYNVVVGEGYVHLLRLHGLFRSAVAVMFRIKPFSTSNSVAEGVTTQVVCIKMQYVCVAGHNRMTACMSTQTFIYTC